MRGVIDLLLDSDHEMKLVNIPVFKIIPGNILR
jgi:hypothetical protein